jgi:hypothetical protein
MKRSMVELGLWGFGTLLGTFLGTFLGHPSYTLKSI